MVRKFAIRSLPRNLLFAIFILTGLLGLTFSLVFARIIVPGHLLTNQFKVGYTIAVTLLTTVLVNYVRGEIQRQWLRYINHEISNVQYQVSNSPSLGPRWRAVLGISTIEEQIRCIRSTALAQISFIATGLVITAVVTAVTLQDTICVSQADPPRIHSGADSNCAKSVPNQDIDRLSPLWEYRTFWNKSDGSSYFATTNLGCPSWSGAQNLGQINTVNPAEFAYARSGVAIDKSAVGAPEVFYTQFPDPYEPGEQVLGHRIQQQDLRSVTQCLPVMASNPIKCTPGGVLKATAATDGNGTYHNMNINAGGCQFDQMMYESPLDPFGLMVARLCATPSQGGNDAVGRATIAMGATNIMSLTLAAAVGDTSFLKQNADKYNDMHAGKINNLAYSLSCTIDVQPTIKWRTLNLTLEAGAHSATSSYNKRVSGIDGCAAGSSAPDSAWDLGDGYAGGAVAALVPPLSEGRYWNGMTNTILNQALNTTDTSDRYDSFQKWSNLIRAAPFGFNESTNALEDVLGLTTGITMSQMSTLDSQAPGSPLVDSKEFYPPVTGTATFSCTRVGPGERYALLFCLPMMVALAMAIYLLVAVPVGKTAYKSSRLEDLIAIGRASERELMAAWKADQDEDEDGVSLVRDAQEIGMSSWKGEEQERSETPVGWNHGLYPPLDPAKLPPYK